MELRVLVTVSPLMYREAIALSIRQHRPGYEVRIVAPEDVEEQLGTYRPRVLVRNDTDGLDSRLLGDIPCLIEVLYSDGMDARTSLFGRVEETRDISTEMLLTTLDRAASSNQ